MDGLAGPVRVRAETIASDVGLSWRDGVVPLAMEIRCGDVEAGDLGVGHLGALLVEVMVQPTLNGEPGLRGCAGDQLDVDLMCHQRLAAPVLGDEREQSMLDAVPLAGPGRQVGDGDRQPGFVGERLKDARIGRLKPLCDFDWTWPKRCDRAAVDALYRHADLMFELVSRRYQN